MLDGLAPPSAEYDDPLVCEQATHVIHERDCRCMWGSHGRVTFPTHERGLLQARRLALAPSGQILHQQILHGAHRSTCRTMAPRGSLRPTCSNSKKHLLVSELSAKPGWYRSSKAGWKLNTPCTHHTSPHPVFSAAVCLPDHTLPAPAPRTRTSHASKSPQNIKIVTQHHARAARAECN